MIGSTAMRIYFVALVILATYGGARLVRAALEPPEVDLPGWTFRELPIQFGDWHGADATMDPKIAVATEANIIVNREYRDDHGHAVSIHTAVFKRPDKGVYHSPVNCYRAAGWQKTEDTREKLKISDGLTIPVSVTTWEREGERVVVVYWFQLGEHVLFGRWDLGLGVRWSLRGQPKWPPLIKVLLQIQAPDREDARTTILSFAEQLAKWEYQPDHRQDAAFDKAGGGR
jgi:EpsI family protein